MDHVQQTIRTKPASRPKTILRASSIGECLAMLMAVHSVFSIVIWTSYQSNVLLASLMMFIGAWIVLRTVGFQSGHLISIVGTFVSILLALYAAGQVDQRVPDWLAQSLCSWSTFLIVLSLILIVDLCDIPWTRGWTLQQTFSKTREQLQRVPSQVWGWGLAGLFALYMIVVPGVDALLEQFREPDVSTKVLEDMTFAESVRLRTTEAFTAAWFFVLGSTIGSYLNVVVYRIPRKESLWLKRSACPKCDTQIAGRDNIPILGWIWLNGQCRSCQLPISIRYPLVEGIVGGIFLLFYFIELLSGGANLPVRNPNSYAGVVWIIFYTKWDLVGLYLFHCFLLVALLAWSLIRFDDQRVPWRSICTTFMMATVPPLIWTHLILVPWYPFHDGTWAPSIGNTLTSMSLGAFVGIVLGISVNFLLRTRTRYQVQSHKSGEREFIAGMTLVGTMLGWQAAMSLIAVSLLIYLMQNWVAQRLERSHRRRWSLTGALLIATLLQLVTWRLLSTNLSAWWPVTHVTAISATIWVIAIIMLLVLNRQGNQYAFLRLKGDTQSVSGEMDNVRINSIDPS